jgi:hypothetical protein
MPTELRFTKTGAEIKAAAATKMIQIQSRLKRRHETLDEFLRDQIFVRSYLIRSSKAPYGMHGGRSLWSEGDISSERMEEIRQLCERIFDLESELHRLQLIVAHLADHESFALTYEDLAGYGFEV